MIDPDADDLDALLDHLGDPRGWLFVIDFDGTLSPIVDHPDDAAPAPGAREALAALAEVTPVALLSGRGLDDLAARLGDVPAGLRLVGGHGSEARHPDGRREALTDLAAARSTLDAVENDLRRDLDEHDGWLVERKDTSVAVHHRRVPDDDVDRQLPQVRARLEAATGDAPGFVVVDGKAVLELKVAGVDKGRALRWLTAAVRSDGGTEREVKAVVLGDDTTDEDAFAEAIAAGGAAVRVAETDAPTSARFRLRDPSRVVTLLRAARAALGDVPAHGPTSGPERR